MSIDKHKPVKARSQSFRALKDQNDNRLKSNLQIPLVFSFEKDLSTSTNNKRSSSSGNKNELKNQPLVNTRSSTSIGYKNDLKNQPIVNKRSSSSGNKNE